MRPRIVALLLAGALLTACGRPPAPATAPAPLPPATPEPAPVEPAPEPAAFAQVGLSVILPDNWTEVPTTAGFDLGVDEAVVAFRPRDGALPTVVIAGLPSTAWVDLRKGVLKASGAKAVRALAEELKKGLLEASESQPPTVVSEETWTAIGLLHGWRIRVQGPDKEFGPVFGDLMVAESILGGAYVVLAKAKDEAGLTEVADLLDKVDFRTPPTPVPEDAKAGKAPAEKAAPDPAAKR